MAHPLEETPEPIVELVDVRKSYEEAGREHVVLDDASLSVQEGEFVVLLGRSGSGKTTLLNLIGGIDAPDGGDVRVRNQSLARMSDRERTVFRRRHIGFVYQFFNLIATLTVAENVRLPLDLIGHGDADGRARDLLARVALADRGDTFPDRLSGGEQQRVAIARALAAGADIVLADEPTGNLDADTGDAVLRLLVETTRDRGGTLIAATHSRAVAAAADRVVRVVDGRLEPLQAEPYATESV